MTPPNHPSIHPPTHTPTIGGGDSTDHKIFEQNKIISISSRFIRTLGSLARGTAISSSILTIFPTRDRIYKGSVGTVAISVKMSRCQDDIFPRIELIPSFVLSSDNTNCKNDIQLFHQLFDELSVHTDYH